MSCLVDSDGTTFRFRGDFRLLFQTTNNTVYSIEEILFAYELFAVAGSDQCSLIADIGDIGTEKPGFGVPTGLRLLYYLF